MCLEERATNRTLKGGVESTVANTIRGSTSREGHTPASSQGTVEVY